MRGSAADLVNGAVTVSSPPLVYQRLVEVINHPRSGPSDIARVISEDPGLTTRLLRVVNSAFFSFPQRVETVKQAVAVVGTVQVRDLALATSVITLFEGVPADLVNMESFWRHSLATGVGARILASLRHEDNVERFFVAGLLHDVGRLIIYLRRGEQAREILDRAEESGEPLHLVESAVLGFHHAQVGGALLELWSVPASYREAVAYHHTPRLAERYPIETAAVHVSDLIANALELGSSGSKQLPPLDPEAWDRLGIDVALLPLVVEDMERQLEAVAQFVQGAEAA